MSARLKIGESVYLAARYSRHPEMQGVRDVLEALGLKVTSRWIDAHGGELQESYSPEQLNRNPETCAAFGEHDVEDLLSADTVISFTESGGGGKGGRHVEFGIALAAGKRLIVVGPREHIFHALDRVEQIDSWSYLVRKLAPLLTGERSPYSPRGLCQWEAERNTAKAEGREEAAQAIEASDIPWRNLIAADVAARLARGLPVPETNQEQQT